MRACILLRRIARAPRRARRRRTVRRTAAELRAWGVDLPASDWQAYRQMLRGTKRIQRAAHDMGLSAREAGDACRAFGQALRAAADAPPRIPHA